MYRGRTMTLSLPPFTRAVKWLVLVNAAIFFLQALLAWLTPAFADAASYDLALVPAMVVRGGLWQLITYSFLHVGISHILLNMLKSRQVLTVVLEVTDEEATSVETMLNLVVDETIDVARAGR